MTSSLKNEIDMMKKRIKTRHKLTTTYLLSRVISKVRWGNNQGKLVRLCSVITNTPRSKLVLKIISLILTIYFLKSYSYITF